MREGEPGWFYVGDGQLRFKDRVGWTQQYKAIDGPRDAIPTVNGGSPDPAGAQMSPKTKRARLRPSVLAMAVCGALVVLGVGAGLGKPDVLHGWVSWASLQASQGSPLVAPTVPIGRPALVKVKAKVRAKAPAKVTAKVPAKLAAKAPAKVRAKRPSKMGQPQVAAPSVAAGVMGANAASPKGRTHPAPINAKLGRS